jgi:hypothetical protein
MAIALFTATHRAICVWFNVSFIYSLAVHPQISGLVAAQWYFHVLVLLGGLTIQGAVSAPFYVPCMEIPGLVFILLASVLDLLGVFASVSALMQVQGALEITARSSQVDEVAYLVSDVAPEVVSNISMGLGIVGSSGFMASVFGLYTIGFTEKLVAIAKTKHEIAKLTRKSKPKRKKKRRT